MTIEQHTIAPAWHRAWRLIAANVADDVIAERALDREVGECAIDWRRLAHQNSPPSPAPWFLPTPKGEGGPVTSNTCTGS